MWNVQLRIPWPRALTRTYEANGKHVFGSTAHCTILMCRMYNLVGPTERNGTLRQPSLSNGLYSLTLSCGQAKIGCATHKRWTPSKSTLTPVNPSLSAFRLHFTECIDQLCYFQSPGDVSVAHFSFRKDQNIDRLIMSNYRPSNQTIRFHFVCSNRLFRIDCGDDDDDHVAEMLRAISVFTRLT